MILVFYGDKRVSIKMEMDENLLTKVEKYKDCFYSAVAFSLRLLLAN